MYALVLQNQTVGAISIFGCIACMYALAVKVKQREQSSFLVSLHVPIAVHTTRQAVESFYEYKNHTSVSGSCVPSTKASTFGFHFSVPAKVKLLWQFILLRVGV